MKFSEKLQKGRHSWAGIRLQENQQRHTFLITEVTLSLPEDRVANLPTLLQAGPAGIAEFDEDTAAWLVW